MYHLLKHWCTLNTPLPQPINFTLSHTTKDLKDPFASVNVPDTRGHPQRLHVHSLMSYRCLGHYNTQQINRRKKMRQVKIYEASRYKRKEVVET